MHLISSWIRGQDQGARDRSDVKWQLILPISRRPRGSARQGCVAPRPEAGERDDRRTGQVRIMDFGLAVAEEEVVPNADISGTPAYMAP